MPTYARDLDKNLDPLTVQLAIALENIAGCQVEVRARSRCPDKCTGCLLKPLEPRPRNVAICAKPNADCVSIILTPGSETLCRILHEKLGKKLPKIMADVRKGKFSKQAAASVRPRFKKRKWPMPVSTFEFIIYEAARNEDDGKGTVGLRAELQRDFGKRAAVVYDRMFRARVFVLDHDRVYVDQDVELEVKAGSQTVRRKKIHKH